MGFIGGILLFGGAVAVALVLMVLAALGLLAMALVGILIAVDRVLGLLVPAYRRRRARRLAMPAGLVRVVRFGALRLGSNRSGWVRLGSDPAPVIEARSHELPHEH